MTSTKVDNPVVLVSIDGWGHTDKEKGNAILHADTPHMTAFSQSPHQVLIDACGLSVGLPKGVMGNSEVGHLTMGVGRVEFQDLVRINMALEDGSFYTNPRLVSALDAAKKGTGRFHLLGLVSDGGVHSHIDHLEAFLRAAKKAGVPHTYVHFFADGRDTPPTSGTKYVRRLQSFFASEKYGAIATVVGRYYAMDRDKRWERIGVAYEGLFAGKGDAVEPSTLVSYIEGTRYTAKQNDEFLTPIIVDREGQIKDGDALLFFDYRSDRMREINQLFAEPKEPLPFPSTSSVDRASLHVSIMTQYDEKWSLPIVYPPQTNVNALSEWLSKKGLRQFHTAETEKYAHVTFFFNGGVEQPFPHEDRALIPSPKVRTYDLQPEMSQAGVGDSVVEAVRKGDYAFIMCNFAAPDMVGHTGVFDAAVKACTACDVQIGRIAEACGEAGYTLIVTADHGNAEEMEDEDGKPKTSHTTNLIPFIIQPKRGVDVRWTNAVEKAKGGTAPVGGLSDVAPTVLTLMGLDIPKEMTGKPLVQPLK